MPAANPPASSRSRPRLARVLPIGAVLAVLLLFFILQLAQLWIGTPMDWEQALRVALDAWESTFVFAFWATLVAVAYPLRRGSLRVSVPAHLVAFVLVVAVHGMFSRFGPPPGAPFRSHPADAPNSPDLRPPIEGPNRLGPPGQFRGPGGDRRLWALFVSSKGQLNLVVYFGTLLLVHAVGLVLDIRERDRRARELAASLTQARLSALQLQLQPHFLFNSLNAISTLVHKDPHAADEMITNLSELLRLSLATKAPIVPLRQELELLDRYLAIEQVRFGARLRIERVISPAALEVFVPTLLLQPLAENAVRHGLEPKPGPGMIRLSAAITDGRLRLLVEDDGVGLPKVAIHDERRGVGLDNTAERLRELYGESASLTLRERPEGGTSVALELPVDPPAEVLGFLPSSSS